MNITLLKKYSLFVLIGGAGGYLYYYFIGCSTGTCPITSNPYVSVLYGALIGTILSFPGKKG
jgi:hypothetical protein